MALFGRRHMCSLTRRKYSVIGSVHSIGQLSSRTFTAQATATKTDTQMRAAAAKAVPVHFKEPKLSQIADEWEPVHNVVWTAEELAVEKTHKKPEDFIDRVALFGVKAVRFYFDIFSGYAFGPITKPKLLRRVIFLETVAGVPGMVAGSLRHLRSLRRVQRDHGWIHTLLSEAENERMHMLCFEQIKKPGPLFKVFIALAQGIFWNVFFLAYMLSPKLCHRFVGYLEEEAVHTYSEAIKAIDSGAIPWSKEPAPEMAKKYWKLGENATMRDMVLAVRADEAHHRDVNHVFGDIDMDDVNPFLHQARPSTLHTSTLDSEPASKKQ
eukprot:g38170.t1